MNVPSSKVCVPTVSLALNCVRTLRQHMLKNRRRGGRCSERVLSDADVEDSASTPEETNASSSTNNGKDTKKTNKLWVCFIKENPWFVASEALNLPGVHGRCRLSVFPMLFLKTWLDWRDHSRGRKRHGGTNCRDSTHTFNSQLDSIFSRVSTRSNRYDCSLVGTDEFDFCFPNGQWGQVRWRRIQHSWTRPRR